MNTLSYGNRYKPSLIAPYKLYYTILIYSYNSIKTHTSIQYTGTMTRLRYDKIILYIIIYNSVLV